MRNGDTLDVWKRRLDMLRESLDHLPPIEVAGPVGRQQRINLQIRIKEAEQTIHDFSDPKMEATDGNNLSNQ